MNKLIFLTILISSNAFAHGRWVSAVEKNNMLQCTVQECRSFADVPKYFEWCSLQRDRNVGHGTDSPIWQIILPNKKTCHCPCDYGFEHRVRTGEDYLSLQERGLNE